MCGIAGGINSPVSGPGREHMLRQLAHRGPDDQGIFSYEHIWLGNVRLSIRDLSQRGHQPMQSTDGRYTLVYNGELYNNSELRKELESRGYHFQSDSDTETLLYSCIAYGTDCLQKLNGIFAFAFYDRQEDTLLMARDPLGVKPFYYYDDGKAFLFSSELKTLSHINGLDYRLDNSSFASYIQLLYQPGTATPFLHIHKLLPGAYLLYQKGQLSAQTKYYRVPFDGRYNTSLSKAEWVRLTDEALIKAVGSQMVSDAPVGFFLSGGLDSSLVTAIARKSFPYQQFQCFTINTGNLFQQEGFEDDVQFARLAARHLDMQLTEVDGRIDMQADFDRMIWQMDEPQADPAALYVKHIAAAAGAQGIKVMLSGAGADDVFSGYRRHQALYYERLLSLYPDRLKRPTVSIFQRLGKDHMARRLSKIFSADGNAIQQRIHHFYWLETARIRSLFNSPEQVAAPGHYFEQLLEEIPQETAALNQLLYWEMCTFLPDHNLNYTDKMSMAAGIETRVPYLDTDLIALSASMPPELKMNGRQTKFILREVAEKYLPKTIIHRKKTGFGAPLRQWIKGEMKPFVHERLLDGSFDKWGIFDKQAIELLVRDNETGKVDASYSIFALLAVESWLRQFAAQPTGT